MSALLLLAAASCSPPPPPVAGLPPLHQAARAGDVARLRALLDGGAPADERDAQQRQPLHWAAWGGSAEAVELLLGRGADVDAPARFGMAPLHLAAMAGRADAADLLLRRGADGRGRNAYGMTPLHEAAGPEVARVLLGRGAPVDVRDLRGMTPLHLARNGKVAKVLLGAGADVFARAQDGRRPLDMATAADWERDGLVVYAARGTVRLRGESAPLAVEIRNVSEREAGPIAIAAESPACRADPASPPLERLQPGELAALGLSLERRPGVAEGAHPLRLTVTWAGRPIALLELRMDTRRAETPEDRGMVRLGKATIRKSPSRLQYLAFALVPLILAGLWLLRRRQRGPPAGPAA